jgi:predicted MFS family arabinose efflux permease
MELSVFVAKIIALLYLAAGVAALRGVINFAKIVDDYDKSPAFTFMSGLFALILGMLLIKYHNIWVKDWTVLITIFGWAAAIKGVLFIAFPDSLKLFKGMFKVTKAWGVLMLLIGVLFGYFGFVM